MSEPASARADLRVHAAHGPVQAAVVVLHGGRATSIRPTSPLQLSVLRMWPFAWGVRRRASGLGVADALLRYRVRGWNESGQDPVEDARWALAELSRRFPGVRLALIGHSLGGRVAMRAADAPGVEAVVGLAPWLPTTEPVPDLTGRRVLIVHGSSDQMTDPAASAVWAEGARATAESVSYVTVAGARHAMLGRVTLWQDLAVGFVLGVLLGTPEPSHPQPQTSPAANTLRRVLAGERSLVV